MKKEGKTAALVSQLASDASAASTRVATRGDELLANAILLKERIARSFWELGRTLALMRDEGVHGALGYERLEDLLAERLGLGRTAAWKLMAIADNMPREEAVKLGQEKAYAVVVYARSTLAPEGAAALARADVAIAGKPLSQASVRDVVAAAAAARPKKPATLAERAQAKADRALLADVRERLARVGVPKAAVVMVGEALHVTLSRSQAARIIR